MYQKIKISDSELREALVDYQMLYNPIWCYWSDIIELDCMGYKGAAATLESFQCDIMNYMHFPENH